MKKNIHPKYSALTIQMPKGDSFQTFSSYAGDRLVLDVDFRLHSAWTKQGGRQVNDSNVTVNKFNQKYGGNLNFMKSSTK